MTNAPTPPKPGASLLKRFLGEEQDPSAVEAVHDKITQLLTSGEEILYIAVQARPVINLTPDCVVLTSKRFILYRPSFLGKVEFEDYIWRELHDAKLEENLLGATLTMHTIEGKELMMDHLPKAQARRLYALAQEMEEKTLEERRQREMEEKRAAAGGIMLGGAALPVAPAAPPPSAPPAEDPMLVLKKLKDMLDAGLIKDTEYETKKAEILSRM
jgi:hypothetical protein